MIKGTCPACGRVFKVDDRYAGQTGRCKSCGAAITVPGQPDEGLDGLAGGPEGADMAPPSEAPRDERPATKDDERGTGGEEQGTREEPVAPGAGGPRPEAPRASASLPSQAADSAFVIRHSSSPASPPAPRPLSPPSDSSFVIRHSSSPASSLPSGPEAGAAAEARALEDPSLTHDARSRFEPSHGPTAMAGPWLKEEAGAAAGEQAASGRADDVLATRRIVTDVEPSAGGGRAGIVTLACVVLGLVGLGYLARFLTAWPAGMVPGAIGFLLAALGAVRLWTGHRDGFIPATLFCFCDIGIVLLIVLSKTPEGQRVGFTPIAVALFAGGALALLFVLAAGLATSARAYFDSSR